MYDKYSQIDEQKLFSMFFKKIDIPITFPFCTIVCIKNIAKEEYRHARCVPTIHNTAIFLQWHDPKWLFLCVSHSPWCRNYSSVLFALHCIAKQTITTNNNNSEHFPKLQTYSVGLQQSYCNNSISYFYSNHTVTAHTAAVDSCTRLSCGTKLWASRERIRHKLNRNEKELTIPPVRQP